MSFDNPSIQSHDIQDEQDRNEPIISPGSNRKKQNTHNNYSKLSSKTSTPNPIPEICNPNSESDDNNMDTSLVDNKKHNKRPSMVVVHLAIMAAQVSFGGGSVVAALGLPATNPVLFALIREGIAGPLLCLIAYIVDRELPSYKDWFLFFGPGLSLFGNQLFFIIGIKISSSITASAWQPSQAIIAVIFGYCFGIEKNLDIYKIFGIIFGTSGAIFMILYNNTNNDHTDFIHLFGGSICFFINCSSTALYLILSRKPLKKYPSSTVTGYSYIYASLLMAVAALIVASSDTLLNFVCADCNGKAWEVPTETIYALIYWILFTSLLSYLFMTWANQYADPSVNLAYSVLQPLTATIASEILILANVVKTCKNGNNDNCLYGASYNDLGAIGIAIGLYFVIYSDKKFRLKLSRLNLDSATDLDGLTNKQISNLIKQAELNKSKIENENQKQIQNEAQYLLNPNDNNNENNYTNGSKNSTNSNGNVNKMNTNVSMQHAE